MTTFLIAALVLVVGVTAATALFIRVRLTGLVFFTVMASIFPIVADTSTWNHWFDWFKRYSVAIPICVWAWVLWRPTWSRPAGRLYRLVVRWMPLILLVNVAEVALKQYGAGFIPNAILLGILTVTIPIGWHEDAQRHTGFDDWPWVTALTLSLTMVYVLDPGFKNIAFGALAVLWIAFAACIFQRSTHTWFTWRAYTLAILVFQDSIFDNVSDFLYPPFMHPDSRGLLQGTAFEFVLLGATGVLVVLVLEDRVTRLVAWRARA